MFKNKQLLMYGNQLKYLEQVKRELLEKVKLEILVIEKN